ncbi:MULTISPECIES: alkaline phosphatase family protein [unclassified Paludibacterium]|uniref:alkaline phosphatase family protein n=1 Tax=unclassified Paludibacterium TaxID=2618429 RepID=UPI001C04FE5C|nr:alkaline phosphatase family protein [Paludibacterium sp. B53371]BEV73531.1 alkaline phosphatase family protein [Paludibacterium sp. THUN1379]
MRQKVILVLIDGLAWQVASHGMGYLLGLCEARQATMYRLCSALPSLSRPLYECILTGSTPVQSGIVHNGIQRLSNQQSIFHLARDAGLVTAAAAYHWISELYNRTPYLARRDRHTQDAGLPIQYGMFYHSDDYPDEHLLLDAEALRCRHDPDFLLIHPMNVDDAGHRFGLDSAQYRNAARCFDQLLSDLLPAWLAEGYQILVTSDHGMNNDHTHGGNLPEERDVPLFVLGRAFSHRPDVSVTQTALCGIAADLLGLSHTKPHCPELLA